MDFLNKKISVIGYGKSGQAAAKRLLDLGAGVRVSESGPKPEGADKRILFETGGHTFDFIKDSDLVVVSPGVHLDIPALVSAKHAGISIISEVELASLLITKPIIAVTGTNGKTTTTTLIGEIFAKAGLRAAVGGNIGHPLVLIDDTDLDYVIAEISSYQLEGIEHFRPHISVFMNLTPDHLERYKTMEAYADAKKRLVMNQTADDFVVYNDDDPLIKAIAMTAASEKVPFSRRKAVDGGVFLNEGYIVRLKENIAEAVIKTEDVRIKGDHNLENCMAASAAALLCGISAADIAITLRQFPGVEHRIEKVGTVNGVAFINDSKGTNPDSTIVALKTVADKNNVVVILGGKDKNSDLSAMCEMVKKTCKAAVLIGEAADRFESELRRSGFDRTCRASSMEEAVAKSMEFSTKGDKILLSPACASFDMFTDFEHRGRVFKETVRGLKNGR